MRPLTQTDVPSFLAEKLVAAIHFDARWDAKYRPITRSLMADAEQALGDRVNFGEVDCDTNPELARSIPILNVPSIAYYRDAKLEGVFVGTGQDLRLRLERLLRGDPVG